MKVREGRDERENERGDGVICRKRGVN